ncbi:hypothetical protein [Bartonella sp. B30(2025)]
MERRVYAMRKLYRKKLSYIISRICVVVFCSLLCVFAIMQSVSYFFPEKKVVQQELAHLSIPTFDLRIYCKEISASVLSEIKSEVYYRCVNLESEAYFAIRDMWDDFSYHVKERCVKMVRPGDGSYFLLRNCFMSEKNNEEYKVRNYF